MLCLEDFYILQSLFVQEVQQLLPLPATVDFCSLLPDGSLQNLAGAVVVSGGTGDNEVTFRTDPWLLENRLVVPLPLARNEHLAIMISEVDPAFLKKISTTWVEGLQRNLNERFERIRLGYVNPETELYNRRAATLFLQQSASEKNGFFFLLNTVFYRRTAAGNLQKTREIAALLQALVQGYCFSFGYGVFGFLLQVQSREQALKTAHHLQHQFKREGLSKVQMGFSQITAAGEQDETTVQDRFWLALAIAEKRGPFGICDIDAFDERRSHPFQLAQNDLLEHLQEKWRGLARFTLTVLAPQVETGNSFQFDECIQRALPEEGVYLGGGENLCLILFPNATPDLARRSIETLTIACQECYGEGIVSIGVAAWPCLDFSKSDIPGNCLKALLHCSFLGPGSVVFFDHLSLNISGDSFFEEGDYRTAIREYRRGLRLQPGDVNLMNSLGVALVEYSQERQAAVCFQDVLHQDPDNYMALVNLGHVRQTMGQKESALDCFERAYRLLAKKDVAGQELFLPLGRLYIEHGDHEKAVEIFEHWRTRPGSEKEFILFRFLGLCYLECGRPDEAIRACQRALHLFPQDSISLSALGVLYVEQDEGSDVGLALCRKALALDNFNPDHWCRLSRALLHTGGNVEALEAVKQCLRLKRNHAEGVLQLGRIHRAMGHDNPAKKRFLQVIALKGRTEKQAAQAKAYLAGFSDSVG
jgi:tetratricopeptide (TPR) repeat protein